jgi:hypothetical protein
MGIIGYTLALIFISNLPGAPGMTVIPEILFPGSVGKRYRIERHEYIRIISRMLIYDGYFSYMINCFGSCRQDTAIIVPKMPKKEKHYPINIKISLEFYYFRFFRKFSGFSDMRGK